MLATNNGLLRKEDPGTIHKIPLGITPYGRAKHVQLVEKDPEAAIPLFWAAINEGDRVESALKDMAIVMKQLGRPLEAIEAIKSFRQSCSLQAQESLDNVLLDLYKKCGMVDEQIVVLKEKLRLIQHGLVFNGNRTKTARSHGKKFQLSIKQETSRLLSNLGWAYMEQFNYAAAELVYRKALDFDADANKACNLGVCLIKQGKLEKAAAVLEGVSSIDRKDLRSLECAKLFLKEFQNSKVRGGCKQSVTSSYNHNRIHTQIIAQEEPVSCKDGHNYYSTSGDGMLSSPANMSKCLGFEHEISRWESQNLSRMVEWASELNNKISRKRHRRLPVFEELTTLNGISYLHK